MTEQPSLPTTNTNEDTDVEVTPDQDANETEDEIESTSDQNNTRQQTIFRTISEWIIVLVVALVLSFFLRTFLVQAYYIPSSSMYSTLRTDDRVLVNKLSYRFGEVSRGDVVVFAKPSNAPGEVQDFIKRVIALPGDLLALRDGNVYVNGVIQEEPYVAQAPTFPDGLLMDCANIPQTTDTCLVPEGMVFVMGDNRQASTDSRVFGPINIDTIVGRAFFKIWPLGDLGRV